MQLVREEDPESLSWLTTVSGATMAAFFALIYDSHRRAQDSAADHVEPPPYYDIVPWYILMTQCSQWFCLVIVSSANERATFSLVELWCWWIVCGIFQNVYMATCFARGVCRVEYERVGTEGTSDGMGIHWAGLPPESWASVVFHLVSVVACSTLLIMLLPSFRRRSDAPPFRNALRIGMMRFKARHGAWLGSVYSMCGNGTPASTFAYHLLEANFFSSSASQVYECARRSLTVWQLVNLVNCLVYYVTLCALSRGWLAEKYAWVAILIVVYASSFIACKESRLRQARAYFCPKQRPWGSSRVRC